MGEKATIVTPLGVFEVDRDHLSTSLKFGKNSARIMGVRSGQPVALTSTNSDPISTEKFYTYKAILNCNKRVKL